MEKRKFKFNIVDAIVVLIIVAAVVVAGMTFLPREAATKSNAEFEISFFCEEVPSFAAQLIKEGDPVTDDDKNTELGKVKKVTVGDSRTYTTSADGNIHVIPKPGYNSVEVTAVVEGQEFKHGMMINSSKYGVGHSLTIRAGKAKIYGRVSGLEKVN